MDPLQMASFHAGRARFCMVSASVSRFGRLSWVRFSLLTVDFACAGCQSPCGSSVLEHLRTAVPMERWICCLASLFGDINNTLRSSKAAVFHYFSQSMAIEAPGKARVRTSSTATFTSITSSTVYVSTTGTTSTVVTTTSSTVSWMEWNLYRGFQGLITLERR